MAEDPKKVKEEVATDLRKGGWGGDAIAFFDGMSLEEVKRTLGGVCSKWGLEDFDDLRKEAKRRRMALDVEDHQASKDPASGHKDISWKAREGRADLRGKEYGLPLEKARQLLPRMIWPTRYQRRLKHCKEDAQREKLEEDERNRQIGRLVELLRKTGMLKEETVREGASSEWMTRRRAMGRRAGTLRAHVRMGVRMREFTTGCLDSDWFKGTGDLMDYIAGRLEEPCGKSIPVSIVAAVRFLEASAEVPIEVARRMKTEGFKRDLVGEEEIIGQVEQRLRERGVAEDIIRRQSKRFRFYRMAYRENMGGAVEAAGMPDEEIVQTSPAGTDVEPLDFEELEAAEETPLDVVGMGTFVMSIVGRSKRRTLHRVGGCYRIPGVDYRDYVVIGDARPVLIEGEKLCGTCFGSKDKAFSENEEVPSSESSSSELVTSDPDDDPEDWDWWLEKMGWKKMGGVLESSFLFGCLLGWLVWLGWSGRELLGGGLGICCMSSSRLEG